MRVAKYAANSPFGVRTVFGWITDGDEFDSAQLPMPRSAFLDACATSCNRRSREGFLSAHKKSRSYHTTVNPDADKLLIY